MPSRIGYGGERKQVERLLTDHERASGFLEPPSHGSGRFALSGSQISGTEAELTGQNISHYQILAKLGEGGMGIVYRAFDTQLLRPVAVKVLSHTALADPQSNRRFLREARAASAMNHPNIAHVYEVAEAGSMRFIVMEHIEGRTLTATIREGPLDFNRVLDFGLQACRRYGRSARARGHSPGHQAVQHNDHSARAVEDSGFRTGQSAFKPQDGRRQRSVTHQCGSCEGHDALHESRAGPGSRSGPALSLSFG